jgi:hypothetical protein
MLRRTSPPRDPAGSVQGRVTYRWAILLDGNGTSRCSIRRETRLTWLGGRRDVESLRPLPKDLLESLGAQHREHVTVTFIYNYSVSEFESLVRARR